MTVADTTKFVNTMTSEEKEAYLKAVASYVNNWADTVREVRNGAYGSVAGDYERWVDQGVNRLLDLFNPAGYDEVEERAL